MVQNKKAKGSVLILVFFLLSRRFRSSPTNLSFRIFLRSYDPCFVLFIFWYPMNVPRNNRSSPVLRIAVSHEFTLKTKASHSDIATTFSYCIT